MLQHKEERDEEGDLESRVIIRIEAIRSGEWFKCKECRRKEVCTDHEIRLHLEELAQILESEETEKLPGE